MKKRIIIVCTLILGILLIAGGLAYVRLRGGVRVKPVEQHTVADQVIFFRQDDEAWGADSLGDSAYTMKSSGCLVTSIASAISTDGEYITPGELNALFSENAVYDSEGNLQWNKLAELDGYHVSVYQNVDVADIEQCLSDGHYPIVRVRIHGLAGIHYVLIVGAADGEYLCMDPLQDELTKLSDYLGLVHAVRCVWKEEDAIVDTVDMTEEQPATEWLTTENELQFPFDLETEVYMPEQHVVPGEALQAATTESLLRAVKQYTDHFAAYEFYNFPSDYLISAERFNAAGELEQREDLAEVLLAVYEEEDLEKEDEIVLEEIFLATDFVFGQTDEKMRQQILDAVMEKESMRQMETETADHPSGFFAYITEMKDTDASLWYAYIMEESSDTSAKACLEDYESTFYWPYISRPTE